MRSAGPSPAWRPPLWAPTSTVVHADGWLPGTQGPQCSLPLKFRNLSSKAPSPTQPPSHPTSRHFRFPFQLEEKTPGPRQPWGSQTCYFSLGLQTRWVPLVTDTLGPHPRPVLGQGLPPNMPPAPQPCSLGSPKALCGEKSRANSQRELCAREAAQPHRHTAWQFSAVDSPPGSISLSDS